MSRREFWDILYELLSREVTIIVTTAYLDEAERSNRIALMYRGRFIRLGSPALIKNEIKKKMLSVVVADSKKAEAVLRTITDMHIIRTGNSLRLFTDSVDKSRKRIEHLLGRHRVDIVSIEEAAPRLEDSFIEIVSREEAR